MNSSTVLINQSYTPAGLLLLATYERSVASNPPQPGKVFCYSKCNRFQASTGGLGIVIPPGPHHHGISIGQRQIGGMHLHHGVGGGGLGGAHTNAAYRDARSAASMFSSVGSSSACSMA